MATFIWPSSPVSITGVATEATLAQVETNTGDTVTELQTLNTKDFATQTTLSSLNSKDFATQTTLNAVSTALTTFSNKTAGALVPEKYDEIVTTYVGATTKIDTVVYKLATVTIATLTMSYDGSDRLIGVVRT